MRARRVRGAAAVVAACASAGALAQDSATWLWTALTADGDALIDPLAGEHDITITLSVDMSPDVNGTNVLGFGGTVFDVLAGLNANKGSITSWSILNSLEFLTGDLTTSDGVSLFNVNAGQVMGFGSFTTDDPIGVLMFTWTVADQGSDYHVAYRTATLGVQVWTDMPLAEDWTVTEADLEWFVGEFQAQAELLTFIATTGSLVGGGVQSLGASDDDRALVSAVQQGQRFLALERLNARSPFTNVASFDLTIEMGASTAGNTGVIQVFDWTATKYRPVASAALTFQDKVFFIPDLGPEFVRPADGMIQIQLGARSSAQGGQFLHRIDHAEIVVRPQESVGVRTGELRPRAPLPPCPGDCTGDGVADVVDILCFMGRLAQGTSPADLDGDGVVGALDLPILRDLIQRGEGAADLNRDGRVNAFDVIEFQHMASGTASTADCDRDGVLGALDVLCFLDLVARGCP
jgi:hypothetical protein